MHYQYAEAGQTFQYVKKIAEYNAQVATFNASVIPHNGETVQLNTRLFHAYEEARATGNRSHVEALEHAGLPLAIASTVVDVAIAVHQQDSRAVAVAMGQLAGGIGGGVVGAGLDTPGGPLAVVTGFAGAVVGGVGGGMLAGASYDVTTALSDFVAKHVNISPRDPVFFDLLAQEQPGILANAHLKTLRESGLFTPQQLETIHAKQMQLGNLELKINSPLRDIQLRNELLAPVHLDLDQPAPAGNLLHGALPQKDTLQLASLPAQNGNAGNSRSETPQPKTSFDGIDLSGIKRAGISGGASVIHEQVGAALVAQGQGKITAAGIGA